MPNDLSDFELSSEYDEQYNPTTYLWHRVCQESEQIESDHRLSAVVKMAEIHTCTPKADS